MNLHLHGCAHPDDAKSLCDLGLASFCSYTATRPCGQALTFEAISLELEAHIETGRITSAAATKHSFVQEAFARMTSDQTAGARTVVFDMHYLQRLGEPELKAAFVRSATAWR